MFLVFFLFAAFFTDNTLQSMIFLSVLSFVRIFFVDKEFPSIPLKIYFIWALIPLSMYWLREDINAEDAILFYIRLSVVALLMLHFVPRIFKSKIIQLSFLWRLSILIPRQLNVLRSYIPDVILLSNQRFRATGLGNTKSNNGIFNYLTLKSKQIYLRLKQMFHIGLDVLYQITSADSRQRMVIQARGGYPDKPETFLSFNNNENAFIILLADLLLICIALCVALPESAQLLPTEIEVNIINFWAWAKEIIMRSFS